jgi:hypothetical protein
MTDQPVKLYGEQAAARAHVAFATWRRYCSESPGRRRQAPEPDGTDVDRGHARPYWYPQTIDAWLADRPGRGVGGGRKPPGSAPTDSAATP